MERRTLAVVEPQMENLFHAAFNAALLHAVVLGFPGAAVSFRARAVHAAAVRGILERLAPEVVGAVEWREIPQLAGASMLGRWLQNARLFREILGPGEKVILCSISRMQLLQLKRMMRDKDEVRAVLHGDLDRIGSPPAERFPASLFALQNVLLRKHPQGLRYVLLSESIKAHLPAQFAKVMANAGVIDHPYDFPTLSPAPAGPVVFGVFGNTGDGRLLEEVAKAVKARAPEVEFRLVGFVADADAVERLAPWVDGVGTKPIGHEEFLRRAKTMTYALWLGELGGFKLRASGTFLDALAYGKPLVYTANAFIDPYYAEAPGIGVRCESLMDVPEAVVGLARRHNDESYGEMQAAIAALRERFTPQALAIRLPQALGWEYLGDGL